MGIAKINGKEYQFLDRDTGLNVRVTCGNVIINDEFVYHGNPLEDITVHAYDLKGRTFEFTDIGMPKKVEKPIPTAVETTYSKLNRRIPPREEIAQAAIRSLGKDANAVAHSLIREGMKKGAKALLGLGPKKKKGKS